MAFAKITRPTSIATLIRLRLFRWLDHAGKKTVTWIWAPPGAGKTTLVASYLASRKSRTIWYQIDEGDNDIATFFYYLGQAAPTRKRFLPLFTPEYQLGLPIFSRNFFRELFNRLKTPFALVFDNYQEVLGDSQLHEVMQAAVSEAPQGGRLIFISRSEPPAAFAPVRAKRAMELMEWSELRFTRSEVRGLLKPLSSRPWPNKIVDQLYETSDGWAAGIVLLSEQLRTQGKPSLERKTHSSEVLFSYFAGEVFKKTEAETKDVLLQTAFLPRVTARMAEDLTGISNAGQILIGLHKQNFFTNRRPGPEPTFEYHPLFREFLLAQARQTFDSQKLGEIQHRAGGLLAAAGQIEAAANLYCEAQDWDALSKLIWQHAQTFMGQGRMKVIEEWIDRIPDHKVENDPWLLYWRGMCRSGWRHAESQRDLKASFEKFRERRDILGMLLCSASLIITIAALGTSPPMDPWIESIEQLMPQIPAPLSPETDMLVSVAMLMGIALRISQHRNGAAWAERALNLTRQHNLVFLGLSAMNWLQYYTALGDMNKAAVVIDDLRALASKPDISPMIAVNASTAQAWYEWLFGLPTYRQTVSRMLELAESSGMFYAAKHATLAHGLLGALSDGDVELADVWIRETAKDIHHFGPGFNCYYQLALVRLALLEEDIERAAAHQPQMLRLVIQGGWPLMEAVVRLISAVVLHKRDEHGAAREHIDCALELARTMKSPYVEFMARKTEADIWFENGEDEKALESLRIAMELGRKGGFVNSQVWMPKVMARLCVKALEAGIEVDYVRMLIRKRNLVPEASPVEIEAWPWRVKIYTLGQFQVLKDDQPLSFSHKVQRKPLALLKAVIAFGGKGVREDVLIDSLWPDADGDAARFALTSAIHRLRKLLGHEQAIIRKDNEISLDDRCCWVDTWALERLLRRSETASNGNEDSWQQATGLIERAAALYKGPFLSSDPEASWGMSLADRLRRRLLRQLKLIGARYEQNEQLQQAADLYEEALRVDTCAEDVCRRLMILYYQLGRPAEVASIYRQCREALNRQLGVSLSAETEELLKKLRLGVAS